MTIPRTAALWRKVLDTRLQQLHTALPCEVVSFDSTAQTVVCQPLIKSVEIDFDGNEIVESYPRLRDVPISWPRAGGFVIVFPLEAGDIVTVLFHEQDLGTFLETGTEDRALILDRHGLSGAVALPQGPYPYADTVGETVDGLVAGYDGGAVLRIKDDGSIELGASAAAKKAVARKDDPVGAATDMFTWMTQVASAINGLVPGSVSPTTPSGFGEIAAGSGKVSVE
jgi:hypothetical protein